jgi:hypothetical protein
MRQAGSWTPDELDDEVLDRVRAVLSGKHERLDSPHAALQPHWDPLSSTYNPSVAGEGMGMAR